MNFSNKKVFFFLQRNWGIKIGNEIAKKIYNEGAVIGGLTFKYHHHYLSQTNIKYSFLQNHDEILESPKTYLNNFDCTLESICNDLNIKSIWPYVQSLRDHVKSYRNNFYYDFKQNVSDETIILYIKAIYKFLIDLEKSFSPNVVVLPNFVSLVHIMTYFFFKKRKIKCIGATTAMINNRFIFINDFLDTEGSFFKKIEFYEKNGLNDLELINQAKITLQEEINNLLFKEDKIVIKKDFFISFLKFFYNFSFNFFRSSPKVSKLFGIKKDQAKYHNKYLVRDFIRKNINIIKSNRLKYYKLSELSKFAYMPLQFQPEENIDVVSSSYNNQIEVARQIAMNLPGDMTLAVKDHPQMYGLRSYKYLEKILKTPNVKLLDYDNASVSILKKSSILVAPTGTTFYEAALLKKPAVLLGGLGTSKILPNTIQFTSYYSLPDDINRIISLSKKWDDSYDKKMLIIISAILKEGFDLNYRKIWEKNFINHSDLDSIVEKFREEIINNF
jgi:hypothetical protein